MQGVNKDQIEILVELQKIDTESSQVRARLCDVDSKLGSLDLDLQQVAQTLMSTESLVKEEEGKYREFETEVQNNVAKLSKWEQQLRSIKTNKEYQSLLREMDELKKKNSKIEEDMIVCLEKIETQKESAAAQKQEFERIEQEIGQEKETIQMESEGDKQKLVELEKHWQSISERVDPTLLSKFKLIRDKVKGVAIVPVKNAICYGCHMNIPPQMFNELQRCDTLRFCPYCQRIIYWEQPE